MAIILSPDLTSTFPTTWISRRIQEIVFIQASIFQQITCLSCIPELYSKHVETLFSQHFCFFKEETMNVKCLSDVVLSIYVIESEQGRLEVTSRAGLMRADCSGPSPATYMNISKDGNSTVT